MTGRVDRSGMAIEGDFRTPSSGRGSKYLSDGSDVVYVTMFMYFE